MLNLFKILLVLGLFSQLLSCKQGDNISESERNAIIKEIQAKFDGYIEAMKREDIDWFHSFWSNENDFTFAGDGVIKTNYDSAITKAYGDAFKDIKEVIHLNWSNPHALIIDRNTVSYVTNFDWQAAVISGDTVKAKGSWLYLFKKTNGQWKVVHSAGTHIYN